MSPWHAARLTKPPSTAGLLFGTLLFAASLTPSLLPRTALLQGIVSGLSFAAGYGFGVALRRLWTFLALPSPPLRTAQVLRAVAVAACLATALPMLCLARGR